MNIAAVMAQAKKMQAKRDKEIKVLHETEFKIEKQGVTVVIMGNRRIKNIDMHEALVDPEDKETLQDLTIIAINEAQELIDIEEKKIEASASPSMPF